MRGPRNKDILYDTGVVQAIKLKTGRDIGRLMENLVTIELMRRGVKFYYYRSVNGREVDCLIKQGLKVGELIQVCYDIDHHETRKRELISLVKAGKAVECDHLTVFTWDFKGEEKYSGEIVNFLPLWRWLISR